MSLPSSRVVGLAVIAMFLFVWLPAMATPANDPAAETQSLSAEVSAQNPSQQATIPTRAGLRLMLRAVCGNVRVVTDSADSVKYILRTDPRMPDSAQAVSLLARKTPTGVALVEAGASPRDCAGLVYEIHVPHRYDLDISVESGDLTTQDIDGSVAFSTGGGEIRLGNVGKSDDGIESPGRGRFAARLRTAGGDVCVGNVAGGLRVETAGGQISAGDVHGAALLRTGGGDVHVGHVFGAARFETGGGDIVAQKIDGGIWANTSGGRVEIGDAARLAGLSVPLSPQAPERFEAILPPDQASGELDPLASEFINLNEFARLFDDVIWGGIPVSPADQQIRLVASVAPAYPDVAQLAGIEGDVALRIFVTKEGIVRAITPLSGPPILARAAVRAVEQWRYAPALLDGHPVGVVSTVTLAFRLHR